MFNGSLKEDAIKRVQDSEQQFNNKAGDINKQSLRLLNLRRETSQSTIVNVEHFINSLANSPKDLDKSFSEYKNSFKTFNSVLESIIVQDADNDMTAYSSAAGGVGAGIAVAALAPTAAMAAATTFGVASTGTAIGALSGAAATNAALAWIGGGALAAGGGGMAAGSGFLALAGPVGWAIGGAALIGTGLWKRSKNAEIAKDADIANKKLRKGISELSLAEKEIDEIFSLTRLHSDSVQSLLTDLESSAPADYANFNDSHKSQLIALVNNIQSLSGLLNKKAI
jgi:hypothetical protein